MPQEPQRPTILQSWKSCCEHCRLQPQVTELCILLLPVKPQDFALSLLGHVFLRCFQDQNVIVYINHDSKNLYQIWSMLLLFGMCNVVPQGVIWWETSAGSIPFQLTTEVFANQRLGLSAFASEIMLESFEKKSYGNKKRFEKWQRISLHVVHVETDLIYDGAGMSRPLFSGANTARAFQKKWSTLTFRRAEHTENN